MIIPRSFINLLHEWTFYESDEQMAARYFNGLKPSIQDVLVLQSLWSVLEAYNQALLVEKQQLRGVSRSGQPYQGGPI